MNCNLTFIVAESNEGHFLLTKKSFHRWGLNHPVIRFADTQKIFDFLSAAKICDCLNERKYILIYSLVLPYGNDLDILRTIKNDDELKKIPIVVLSTLSDTKIVQLCQEIGCHAFFTKPLQKDSFLQLIATFGAETGDPKSL